MKINFHMIYIMNDENAIIQVTTHGIIPLNDKGEPELFKLPPGMTLIKMSAVTPGVCNFLESNISYYTTSTILKNMTSINRLLNHEATSGEPLSETSKQYFNSLANLFRNGDTLQVKEIASRVQSRLSQSVKTFVDPDEVDYFHTLDRNYVLTLFKDEQLVANKLYERSDKEFFGVQPGDPDSKTHTWDFKVNRLDQPGQPDLMMVINTRPVSRSKVSAISDVSLKELLFYLRGTGVKNVIIFDFSCSAFSSDEELVDTTTRVLRRGLAGYYGGKNKKLENRENTEKQI
jgi:hypothetical protein